jgi:hypothetical protein
VAVALTVLAAACTSGGAPEPTGGSTGSSYRPRGEMVILAGRFLARLSVLDAASGTEKPLRLPFFGGAYTSAWPAENGRFYAMPLTFGQRSRNQLYIMGGGRPPDRVGPTIGKVADYQIQGGWAVTWGCPGDISVLNLDDPSEWKVVGHACSATVSPDGSQLAYTTPGALFVMDLPAGTPREVLRFRDLPELHRADIAPVSLDDLLWGDPGIAIQVGDASRSAIVVWRDDGPPVVKAQGRARLGQMQWQPGGRLLAFFDYAPHGEVMTLDPDSGEQRQIAAAGDFGRLAWSPDGKVVATSRSENVIAVVEPRDGGQITALPASGVPIIWLGPE